MKSYYPDTARKIQEKAEAQCQLLDYEGSRLYDEYPDRFMLYHICHQVKGQMEGDTSVQEIPGGFLDDLIQVLVYQEISRRRCRRRGAENVSALSIKILPMNDTVILAEATKTGSHNICPYTIKQKVNIMEV